MKGNKAGALNSLIFIFLFLALFVLNVNLRFTHFIYFYKTESKVEHYLFFKAAKAISQNNVVKIIIVNDGE